jgi:hypothetical protein
VWTNSSAAEGEHRGQGNRIWANGVVAGNFGQRLVSARRGEPAVGERFFDNHADTLRMRPFKRFSGGAFEEIPGDLHRVEYVDIKRTVACCGLARTRDGQPYRSAGALDAARPRWLCRVVHETAFALPPRFGRRRNRWRGPG